VARLAAPARRPGARKLAIGVLIGAVGLLFTATGYGHQGAALDTDTLIRRAAVIVEGYVVGVTGVWDATHTQIHTDVRLSVRAAHKGDLPSGSLTIRQLGGTVGDITLAIGGETTFAVGENVFLFLAPGFEQGDFPLVGGEQGKFVVFTNPPSSAELLRNTILTLDKQATLDSIERIMAGARGAP